MKIIYVNSESKIVYPREIDRTKVYREICSLLKATDVQISHKFRNGDLMLTRKFGVESVKGAFTFGRFVKNDRVFNQGIFVCGAAVIINIKDGSFKEPSSDLEKLKLKVKFN